MVALTSDLAEGSHSELLPEDIVVDDLLVVVLGHSRSSCALNKFKFVKISHF